MCSEVHVHFANDFDLRDYLTGKRAFPAAVLVVDRCVWLILSADTHTPVSGWSYYTGLKYWLIMFDGS